MPRAKKPKVGRPSLGDDARTIVIQVRVSPRESAAVAAAVAAENAELVRDGKKPTTTVVSWFRDHGLDPLGLMPIESDDRPQRSRSS